MNPNPHKNLPPWTCIEDAPTPDMIAYHRAVIRAEQLERLLQRGNGGELEKVVSEGRYRLHFGHGKRRGQKP